MALLAKGMDPAAIDASGDKFNTFKSELMTIVTDVSTAVTKIDTNWDGQDSQTFVTDWNQKKAQITAAADHLGTLGQKLKTNAAMQTQTSAK
ncbi:WXG100 family type VII secretion target [Lapillicoccus sp.]|jgi:WXG100 family type VII secretion target|uniref:WXG100 family type VII secretion target n=1 Tax=Lapillicoccus sp. TaxID=1909287 RepID=UPI0025E90FD9|nr:WXG100 family type VII secretion target [Lapillicoccus sp.]